MKLNRRTLLAAVCVLVAGLTVGQAQTPAARIVAVADIHGNYDGFAAILQSAGIIDAKQQWIGGKTVLVQTGDVIDRGPKDREAMDLLMQLEGQAKSAGGHVHALFGNHEIVNIIGDYRDVAPEAFAEFADAKSEAKRVKAYDDLVKMSAKHGAAAPDRDTWMKAHPAGFIEYTESFEPKGKYGRWIRTHQTVATINDIAFMHAGINHTFQGSIDDVNRTVAADIAAWDAGKEAMVKAELIPPYANYAEAVAAATAEIDRISKGPTANSPASRELLAKLQKIADTGKSSLLADDGPMWFRGFALWKETDEPAFTALIGRLGIKRFVAGHTPMPQAPTLRSARNRWDYRIFQIDTGMLGGTFFPGGRPSALEIAGDRITVIYTDSKEVVVPGTAQPAK